jgi:hypothetical protein
MEGDKKRVKESECLEGEITNPQPIQEYEFFVRKSEGEMEAVLPEDRNEKRIKGKSGDRNKSRIFFLD